MPVTWNGLIIRASTPAMADATRVSLDTLAGTTTGRQWIGGLQKLGTSLEVYSAEQWARIARKTTGTYGFVRDADPRTIHLQGRVMERDAAAGAVLIGHESVHSWRGAHGFRGSTFVEEAPAYRVQAEISHELGRVNLAPTGIHREWTAQNTQEFPSEAEIVRRWQGGKPMGMRLLSEDYHR